MRMRRIAAFVLSGLLGMSSLVMAEENMVPNNQLPMPKFMKNVAVHDPSIIKGDDGLYYIFGSHMAAGPTISTALCVRLPI